MIHVSYTYPNPVGSVKKFIAAARELAEFSNCNKRHGCVVVKHGVIVGRGWNKHRNNPEILSPEHVKIGSSIHAEVMALRSAGHQAKDSNLYVVRIGARGDLLLSRPCLRCYTEVMKAEVSEIYHS